MADGKDSLEKVEFAQWGSDETPIDCEVSTGSTTGESSANGTTGPEKREQSSETKRGSSAYRLFTDKVTFIRNGMTSKYDPFSRTTKEQGDSVRPAQKATILKKMIAVLLAIPVVWLLNGMYAHYQTTHGLVDAVDTLKLINTRLTYEVDHLNETLAKEVGDLKATNGALVKFMVKQSVNNSESSATTQFFGLKKFLDSNETTKVGDSFLCKGLSWHLELTHTSDLEDYLGVHLCHDISDFFGHTFRDWSAKATFNLTLAKHPTLNKGWSYVFEKNSEHECYGSYKFVRISNLNFGLIKSSGLKFQVQIKSLELNLID